MHTNDFVPVTMILIKFDQSGISFRETFIVHLA
jgi:hypothetical protein